MIAGKLDFTDNKTSAGAHLSIERNPFPATNHLLCSPRQRATKSTNRTLHTMRWRRTCSRGLPGNKTIMTKKAQRVEIDFWERENLNLHLDSVHAGVGLHPLDTVLSLVWRQLPGISIMSNFSSLESSSSWSSWLECIHPVQSSIHSHGILCSG